MTQFIASGKKEKTFEGKAKNENPKRGSYT